MATILLPPIPVAGSDLLGTKTISNPSDAYTKSIYANFYGEDRAGLMSTLNGRLDYGNLPPEFQLRDFHIQPEQASLARMESMRETTTIYGDGVQGITASADDSSFFTIPGCSLRWYQPYATSVSLLQWSFFLSYNAWRGIFKDLAGTIHTQGVESPIKIRCRLDDNVVDGSTRHLGQNMFHPVSPGAVDRVGHVGPGIDSFGYLKDRAEELGIGESGLTKLGDWPHETKRDGETSPRIGVRGGNPQYVGSEMHTATQFDLHHMTSISKGFHEISVECSIVLPESAGVYLQNVGRQDKGAVTGRGYFHLIGKVSVGIRNARVLNLL